jgi:uncharacterized membrane protein YdjX (TVP38/TMEM64 family)
VKEGIGARTSARPTDRRHPGWLVFFVVALGAVWLAVVFGDQIASWWERLSTLFTSPEEFRAWVESFGAWGPLVYVAAQALQVILAPVPGTLFPPVGALAFGPWQAMALSLVGLALGSAAVFLAARRWGRPWAERLVGHDVIIRYQNLMTARGGLLLWVIFLFPLLPDDAVCALAGLSGLSFPRFMIIATLGRVPAVAAGVFAMAGLEEAPTWVWAAAGGLFVVLVWLGLAYGPRAESWFLRHLRREGATGRDRTIAVASGGAREQYTAVSDMAEAEAAPDRLGQVVGIVVTATLVTAAIALSTGISGLAEGIVLVWGAALAVLVAWVREDD